MIEDNLEQFYFVFKIKNIDFFYYWKYGHKFLPVFGNFE